MPHACRSLAALLVCASVAAGCGNKGGREADARPGDLEAQAHGAYLAAINSNDVETVLGALTDDAVYQSPNEPEIVGKAALRKWAQAYVDAYRFKWEKTSIGFTVSGPWAFERYRYKVANTDKKTGVVSTDVGKGVNVFHHDADGKWRVAIDGWSSDLPAGRS